MANAHSLEIAAQVAGEVLAAKKVDATAFDSVMLGMTVIQRSSFYGAPGLAALIGASHATGPTFAQACATSARVIASAAAAVELGDAAAVLAVACDRTSNGPHLYYPDPTAPGGTGASENAVLDAFNRDPWAKNAMIETAENVAKEAGFTKEQQDEVALLRYQQYQAALADDRAFQRRYMAPITLRRGKKEIWQSHRSRRGASIRPPMAFSPSWCRWCRAAAPASDR